MKGEREIILRSFRESHGSKDNQESYSPLKRTAPAAANPTRGKPTTDPEAVDYRYSEEAGTGEGSVSQPEGPSQI